jgi:hypothetical protein
MPAHRLSMGRIREILRPSFGLRLSLRHVARSLSMLRYAVTSTVERVSAVCLAWPMPEELADAALEHVLYTRALASGPTSSISTARSPAALGSMTTRPSSAWARPELARRTLSAR